MKLNIGDNLRRLRREQNMTQEALAEKLGTSFQSVSRWENGTTYPDIEFLPAIARIFGTTVDGLIGCDTRPSDEEMEQIMNDFCEAMEDESLDNTAIIERIRSLRRDYTADEHIWRIFGDMMYSEAQRWRDPAVMEELRITCREVMAYPHPTWLKNAMVQYMSAIEDDEHLDDFLNQYASDRDISRTSLLWERYTNREEWNHLEQFRVHRLYKQIDSLLGDRGLWRNPGTPNDAWESRWINERKIAILHTICGCTPDEKHPVSGDGEVDFFAADRVYFADIYAAREVNESGISSRDIAEKIIALGTPAAYIPGFENIAAYLAERLSPGDLVITMGAGFAYKVGTILMETDGNEDR